jgi:hypothetical protein
MLETHSQDNSTGNAFPVKVAFIANYLMKRLLHEFLFSEVKGEI